MATREENLKKINAELDAMSDEELDRVAGQASTLQQWAIRKPIRTSTLFPDLV